MVAQGSGCFCQNGSTSKPDTVGKGVPVPLNVWLHWTKMQIDLDASTRAERLSVGQLRENLSM